MWEPFMNDTERITRAHHFENQAFISILTFRNKHLRLGDDKQTLFININFDVKDHDLGPPYYRSTRLFYIVHVVE